MSGPYSVDLTGATKHVGLGRDTILRAINAGELRASRSSVRDDGEPVGKYVIKVADLEAWVDGLATA